MIEVMRISTQNDLLKQDIILLNKRIAELEEKYAQLMECSNRNDRNNFDLIAELSRDQNELLSLIYNAAIGEVAMGYSTEIKDIASEAYKITGVNAEQLK